MPKIDSVEWANVRIDGQNFWQVLIVGDKLIPREVEKVKDSYGTDHMIADWEKELLLSENPEVILIANGWSELLEIDEEFKERAAKLGIELKVLRTPEAVEEYNRLKEEGKKVNALIHTTC